MKSKRFNNSSHPITRIIDRSIESRQKSDRELSVTTITDDVARRVPMHVIHQYLPNLLRELVRLRMVQRGLYIADDVTYERKTDINMTDEEFAAQVRVKNRNVRRARRALRLDRNVRDFLADQARLKGRSVTMGEFEKEIDAMYERQEAH